MNKVKIIAEVGVNHDGKIEKALNLIDEAKRVGVDYVKFQLWNKDTFPKLEHLRLRFSDFEILIHRCKSLGIDWFATPFDESAIFYLKGTGMQIWKIPSNNAVIKNPDTMQAFVEASKNKPTIISTGAFADVPTVALFLSKYFNYNMEDIIIFHCISKYPLQPKDAFLRRITLLKDRFEYYNIGYSDHSGLPELPIVAVSLGAKMIEAHITLDKNGEGPDHSSSLEPKEFEYMIKAIRNVEDALK